MNTHTTTATDDATRQEPVVEQDDQAEPLKTAADADDRNPEEAGYGYGV